MKNGGPSVPLGALRLDHSPMQVTAHTAHTLDATRHHLGLERNALFLNGGGQEQPQHTETVMLNR